MPSALQDVGLQPKGRFPCCSNHIHPPHAHTHTTLYLRALADAPAAIRTALASDHWNAYTERGLDVSGVIRDCGDAFAHNLDFDG